MPVPRIVDDIADLVLGRLCMSCRVSAPGLCAACLARLRGRPFRTARQAIPVACVAAGEYDGLTRELIIEYKERGYRSLARPLGWLLADAMAAAGAELQGRRLTVVRIPSHPRPARGFDALGAIVKEALRALSSAGVRADQEPLLRRTRRYRAMKTLSRPARLRAASGAFESRLADARMDDGAPVIVVDDVLTTGATAAEAVAALARAGVSVGAVAVIASRSIPGT